MTPSEKQKDPKYNESFVFDTQLRKPALLQENRAYIVTPTASLPLNVPYIDAPTTRTNSYDPTYAFFLFKNKQRLEVALFLYDCWLLLILYFMVQDKALVAPDRIILGRFQNEVPKKSYLILCNFLSEVAMDNALQSCTFIACLHLLDRVLASKTLKLQEVQLIGCACLLIASKLEDIYVRSSLYLFASLALCFLMTASNGGRVDLQLWQWV